MFIQKISKLALILITGILFVGCSSSSPFVSDIQDQLKQQNYDAALQEAEQAIQEYPNDPLAYYYKGVILGDLAQTKEDPGERNEYYQQMLDAFSKSMDVAQKSEGGIPNELQNLETVKKTIWRNEHNQGIAYITDDSLNQATEQPVKRSIGHLENATLIAPDSSDSWSVLSQIYYMDKNVPKAIDALETAHSKADSIEVESYLRLADYYRLNEQPEKSIGILEKARENFSGEIAVQEKMVDSYMAAGYTDQAFEILQDLIDQNPENPRYLLVAGTQYYQTALEFSDSLNTMEQELLKLQNSSSPPQARINQLKENISELDSQIEDLTDQAISKLNKVIELDPSDAQAYNTLGIIYQNKAADLFEKRNATEDNEEAAEYDKMAKENLRNAMGYYEKAAEIDPDNQEYWRALYQVYVTLGMDEKAKEAEQKAGLDSN